MDKNFPVGVESIKYASMRVKRIRDIRFPSRGGQTASKYRHTFVRP